MKSGAFKEAPLNTYHISDYYMRSQLSDMSWISPLKSSNSVTSRSSYVRICIFALHVSDMAFKISLNVRIFCSSIITDEVQLIYLVV